jgi:hypothetical protein
MAVLLAALGGKVLRHFGLAVKLVLGGLIGYHGRCARLRHATTLGGHADLAVPDRAEAGMLRQRGNLVGVLERIWLSVRRDLFAGLAVDASAATPAAPSTPPATATAVFSWLLFVVGGVGGGVGGRLDGLGISVLCRWDPGVAGAAREALAGQGHESRRAGTLAIDLHRSWRSSAPPGRSLSPFRALLRAAASARRDT